MATKMKEKVIALLPIKESEMEVRIVGVSQLCTNNFSQKALLEILQKQMGKSGGRARAPKEPKELWEGAFYRDSKGRASIPSVCFKNSLIDAAHQDKGISKVCVRGAIFVSGVNETDYLTIEGEVEPYDEVTFEPVRNTNGSCDLRWRPIWKDWSAVARIKYNPCSITTEQLITLLFEGGRVCGLGEHRPQKSAKAWGMYVPDLDTMKISEERDIIGDLKAKVDAAKRRMKLTEISSKKKTA